jgi:DNA-binding NarL/FixJ family response regulator
MSIRVAVIDGHPITRCGLTDLIGGQPDLELVGEAESMAAARALTASTAPHVVTVGVTLPGGGGLALARELRDRGADLGIVLLTSQGEDDVLFRAMDTGVSAFVAKSAPTSEILGAIRHVAVAVSSTQYDIDEQSA